MSSILINPFYHPKARGGFSSTEPVPLEDIDPSFGETLGAQ